MADVPRGAGEAKGVEAQNTQPTPDRAPTDDSTAARAHELYVERGRRDGADLDDWLQAEREAKPPERSRLAIAQEMSLLRRRADGMDADPQVRVVATSDHERIRDWATLHHAEPATGEATSTGPATVNINDAGAGIRFNFPAASRFRPIGWSEWFENFDAHHLVFVFEEDTKTNRPTGDYFQLMKAQAWEEHLSYLR